MRVARAAALRAEILCHTLGREWVAAQAPQSGLTNGTQLRWGGKQAILSQGCQKYVSDYPTCTIWELLHCTE